MKMLQMYTNGNDFVAAVCPMKRIPGGFSDAMQTCSR